MIELIDVHKSYGSFQAVKGVSLTVKSGEIFGFLGVNGAGKTTTLRMMAGILSPTSGEIRIGKYLMSENPREAKSITGYIPDRPYLYAKLTAREFMYFIADLYRIPSREVDQRVDKLLSDYGLTEWQDQLIDSFSHGMKQRLATASALVHHPEILIVDEPMVGLDPHGARLLKQSLKRYAKEGMTIFLSTHSLNVAEEVADRVAIIDRGEIVTVGSIADLRAQTGSHQETLESIFLKLTTDKYPKEHSDLMLN